MDKLGKYEIHEKLGQGSFGTVYRAIDTTNGRKVALKILHPESAQDRDLVQGAIREAEQVQKLGAIPNVVAVYEAGSIDGKIAIASQFVKGKPLTEAIKDQRFNTVASILRVLDELAKALDSVHARGVVHQDVKPANILIDDATGQLFLCDFGLARAARDSRGSFSASIRNSLGGTPNYMAPETPSSVTPKPGQDIFSLGVVAYELFTGRRPFADSNFATFASSRKAAVPKPEALSPLVTKPVEAVLLKAISIEPGKRYSTAGKFVEALRIAADQTDSKRVKPLVWLATTAAAIAVFACLGMVLGMVPAPAPIAALLGRAAPAGPQATPPQTAAPTANVNAAAQAPAATTVLVATPTSPPPPTATATAVPPTQTPTNTPVPPTPTSTRTATSIPTKMPPPQFSDNFDGGLKKEWTVVVGKVGIANGRMTLIDTSELMNGVVMIGQPDWDSFSIEFDVRNAWQTVGCATSDQRVAECYGVERVNAGDTYCVSQSQFNFCSSRVALMVNLPTELAESRSAPTGVAEGFIVGQSHTEWGRFDLSDKTSYGQYGGAVMTKHIGGWRSIAGGSLQKLDRTQFPSLGKNPSGVVRFRVEKRGSSYTVFVPGDSAPYSQFSASSPSGILGFWLIKANDLSEADPNAVPSIDNVVISPLTN
jgi:hypothetical protein